jgi:hypothetical protein
MGPCVLTKKKIPKVLHGPIPAAYNIYQRYNVGQLLVLRKAAQCVGPFLLFKNGVKSAAWAHISCIGKLPKVLPKVLCGPIFGV